MSSYPVGTITENGTEVPIFVDDNGRWTAEHAGRSLWAGSRDKLRDAIRRETKRTTRKVDVPFTFVEKSGTGGIRFWKGTATGIHAGNGNVLYTRVQRGTEVKDQMTGFGGRNIIFGAVTDDVLGRFHQLVKADAEARAALEAFEKEHRINLNDVVTEKINEVD